jgi:protein-tyrosine-phosphatase
VRCEDAMESPQRQVGCRHERGETGDEVEGLEHGRPDTSLPAALERPHALAVGAALEPVLWNRRAAQVPAETLESPAVVRRDRDLRMEFEAPKAPRPQRLLRSGAPLLGFLLAHEPDELCWSERAATTAVLAGRWVDDAPGIGPNAYAVRAMAELGIDLTAHASKSVADIDPATVDLVMTLCAEEVCPAFMSPARRLHWPFPDPDRRDEDLTDAERLAHFRAVREAIAGRLGELAAHLGLPPGT